MTATDDRFARARTVADAVLYEGYVLYPYRASSSKNRVRWQWGVVGPPEAHHAGIGEEPTMRTELVVEGASTARVLVRLRFLHLQQRQVFDAEGAAVAALQLEDREVVTWDEAADVELDLLDVSVADLDGDGIVVPLDIDGGAEDPEVLESGDGRPLGRIDRTRRPLTGTMTVRSTEVADPVADAVRLTIEIENTTPFDGSDRDDAARNSFVSMHTLLAVEGGRFVSMVDPPEWATDAVATSRNHRTWPVLVGEEPERDLVLSSPVILYDHPEIAPESDGDFFDATEIDEMLMLRVMTLTDEEKAEARATDPRAAAIIDRTDDIPPEMMDKLHGAIRYLGPSAEPDVGSDAGTMPTDPFGADFDIPTLHTPGDAVPREPRLAPDPRVDVGGIDGGDDPWWDPEADARFKPEADAVIIDGIAVARGSKVRLHPSRRADAHDVFLAGREATVGAVAHDVDGAVHVAVTIDDDPGSDLYDASGRYLYFAPDEVEPLERDAEVAT